MNLISVKSSNISQIGYEENMYLTVNRKTSVLRVIFTTGFTYDYYQVPKEVYDSFLKSESVGKYFHQNIKDKYDFERVK